MRDLAWRRREPFGFVTQGVWALERAFKKGRALDQAERDTRLRIFFLLALFATGFLFLAVAATRCAVFSHRESNDYVPPMGVARADLVDRNGQLLAVDLTHYGVYVDPREIWDTAETLRVLSAALPALQAQRLEKALKSDRREYLIGGLTPDEKAALQDKGLPGVSFEEEERRVYPLGSTGAHLIGFSDTSGTGLSGAERALDGAIKESAGHGPVSMAMDLRVQAALDDELAKAVAKYEALGGIGIVVNVKTGEILGYSSAPNFDLNAPGKATPDQMTNRGVNSVYELGSVF